MYRGLPNFPLPPDINSPGGNALWGAWWEGACELARAETSRLLVGLNPDEMARRRRFYESIIRHKLTEPNSYQCVRGHFVKTGVGELPQMCAKCGDKTIEHCECGALLLLTYTYSPPYMKANPSSHIAPREACFACSRLYPWASSYLYRPADEDLNQYEEQLLPYCIGFTADKWADAEREKLRANVEPAPVNLIQRVLGTGVDVSDPRHPEHFKWQQVDSNHRVLVEDFRLGVLKRRRGMSEARSQAFEKISSWKQLSGTEFERNLAALLIRAGFAVDHVGGKGDEGADLLIKGRGTKIVVQCKAFSKPVGPGPVRDLYGALMHHQASEAWLVSLEGFSDAAVGFARGKPIQLLPLRALLGETGEQFLRRTKERC